ncbi:zinc knuckle (CCHC-type) family protein [Abeliophyllum distichum]|uniref:Zinc knuckle (CCHC-type) family protein n=1 Tax=Abeliophyllum distichum TaxID=126358 RepID=A0ABD1V203_9LAMI
MATDPITEVVATENQTVATVPSPSVNQTVAQVPSFAVTQTVAPTGHGEGDIQAVSAVEAWKHSDFLCWNYVMNSLTDSLYNVYSTMKTAKELWESLDRKYKTKDAEAKKFIVGRFLDYEMVDSKTVISQVQELQVILHEIHAEGMVLSETFQVAAMIEKLPPAWKDFKNYLKHKRKEMNIEELIVRLRIEEDNKSSETKGFNPQMAKANVVEHGQSSKDDVWERTDFKQCALCARDSQEFGVRLVVEQAWISYGV